MIDSRIKTDRADELIEYIEIKASDAYYPIEDNEDYKMICEMVEDAGYSGQEFVDGVEFITAFRRIKKEIENW